MPLKTSVSKIWGGKNQTKSLLFAHPKPTLFALLFYHMNWAFLKQKWVVVCLILWMPSFERNLVSLIGFSLTFEAGVDGNAPYQALELQITTLANPGIQTNSYLLSGFNPNTA